ncbi:MAG: protein kinase domain-containing protein [Microbacteriaceae bacterium]
MELHAPDTAQPDAAQSPALTLGDRYRLDQVIGTGGMSTVFRARDEHLHRDVAIKLYDASSTEVARQESELAVLASLDHHGLVTLLDAGVSQDASRRTNRFLVMTLVTGTNLRDRLRGPRIAARNIAEIGYDMAEALEYVHSRGVIHRDIKPSNIMLVDYGLNARRARARLTDFGIALTESVERLTLDGQTTGTAAYLSPEQASGQPVTTATDVYSLGLSLLQCFTRTIEFPGTLVESAMARLSRDPVVPDFLPANWKQLFATMMHRDPALRPDGKELVSMFRQIVIAESARHKDEGATSFGSADVGSLIDTIPDEVLHRVTAMAARLFSAPISAVSLIESGVTRLVSHFGDEVEANSNDIDLSNSQAPSSEPVLITDALTDPRSKDSRLVKGPLQMRFYAGAPLTLSDGRTIGTLSVMGTTTYVPQADDMASLHDLAALVIAQLELPTGALSTDGSIS